VGRLASETAAQKLWQILGLLVIPILVLWAVYFTNAKSNIDVISREIAAVEKAQAILQQPKSALADLENIYREAGLSFDTDKLSHDLALVVFVLLPKLEEASRDLVARSVPSSQAGPSEKLLFANDLAAARDVQLVLARIADVIPLEQKPVPILEEIQKSVDATVEDLTQKSMQLAAAQGVPNLISAQKKFADTDYSSLQSNLLSELSSRLAERRGAMWRNLSILTLAGFISSFAGIGLSVVMMRSAFKQLDEVEHANARTVNAKREAEQVALRFTSINNDISTLNQELALKVKDLTSAQDELIRKNRIEHLGQLTATIAHEIRNPLGAIRTSIFMLERKMSKAGIESSELIERINNSVNRCDGIISQLHDFARVKEPVNSLIKLDDWLSKVVREEAGRLPPSFFIECSLGLEDLKISFDPTQLQRAIVNILNNASEAMLNDVQKEGAAKQKCIWVTTLKVNDSAVIRIVDNGPGIAEEHLSRIREPLYTTKSFGSGLGIPVVEQIVKMQGGYLDIASVPGAGAKFSIHLPISNRAGDTHVAA
jgi:signal transduction histidine kinase